MRVLAAVVFILGGATAVWGIEPPVDSQPPATPTPPPASVLVPTEAQSPPPAPTGLLENRLVGALVPSDEQTGVTAGDVVFSADGFARGLCDPRRRAVRRRAARGADAGAG